MELANGFRTLASAGSVIPIRMEGRGPFNTICPNPPVTCGGGVLHKVIK